MKSARLSLADTAWLRMDTSTNPMIITMVATYDEPLPLAELVSFAEQQLQPIARFRQRLVPATRLRAARWELDPDFDVRGHVHHVALPEPRDDGALEQLVSDVMSRPLDRRKPLWELHLVDGYGAGSALVMRLHHAMADGVALVRLLQAMTGVSAGATPHAVEVHHHDGRGALAWGGRALAAAARLLLLPPDPRTSLKGPLGTLKRAAWSHAIPLAHLKAIAHRNDATVNDLFATLAAGGLRHYLETRAELRPELEVRAAVPVNLRSDDDGGAMGNRFGLVFLGLPLGIASPHERLREIVRRTRVLKHGEEAVVTYGILGAMALVTESIDELVVDLFEAKTTLVLTSVPGPRERVSLAGRPVRSLAFWAPQAGRVGLGISILSYAGEVRIGVASDAKLVADPHEIVAGMEADLAALAAE